MDHVTQHMDAMKDVAVLTGIIAFTFFALFAAGQENTDIRCDDCITQRHGELTAAPQSTAELVQVQVCTTTPCNQDTAAEHVVCTATGDTCTWNVAGCPTRSQQYWITVETRDGHMQRLDTRVQLRKPSDCPCTADTECASNRCHQAVCTASTPPKLYFK